ncbi:voltage-gated sodium channel [Marinicauda salina]|uniref:Voltage-gated sodium channel n=1 Tax=Marinicauda salina TaxID=2135793 RepID=A0A2U2BSP9_9PROT|nr:ion transporter [Marinicauda salina]PWE17022.1 voltage-gated sodium channel [Marinicauda salina]
MTSEVESAGKDRSRLSRLVESAAFRHFITGLILINALILGATTYPLPDDVVAALHLADSVIIGMFVVELTLKMVAWRGRFFTSGWNWFDLFVVGISLVPSAGAFTVLRALRVLRLFRLFSVLPQMRAVVEALARAIPGMGAILLVLGLIFYVAAVMGAKLFAGTHPQFFGDLGASAFTLFQVMTLESWSMAVARPVGEAHPFAWVFFVVFIILTSFAVLNLFIAVIVDSLQSKHFDEETERQETAHDERTELLAEIRSMRSEIAELRAALGGPQPSTGAGSSSSSNDEDSSASSDASSTSPKDADSAE